MGRRSALVIATVLASVIALALTSPGAYAADEDAQTEITIYGYVTDISNPERNTPLEGVTVYLYGEDTSDPLDWVTTDEDGRFEFTFMYAAGQTLHLWFESEEGYMVRSLPDLDMELDAEGYVEFRLRPDMLDENGAYAITGPADGEHAIVMAITTGSIYVYVYGTDGDERFAISGATVTLVSETEQITSYTENDDGYFTISCPIGTYIMTVSCNGFVTSDQIVVTTGEGYTVTLEQRTSELFLGLDNAHAMMIIGIVMAALMILAAILIIRKSKRPDSGIVIDNDLPVPGDEEEDLRHP